MSLRLGLLNLWLRLFERPFLARVRDIALVRARFERTAARVFVMPRGARQSMERLPGGDGNQRPCLWVSGVESDRRRVILYLHGGAYIMGSPSTHMHLAAALAVRTGARAALPQYRLAPEHPFPAAHDDALAAYRGLLEAGYEPDRVAIAGDSAGGGLALGLLHTLLAEDLPRPACVVAFSPLTDMTASGQSWRTNARREVMLPRERIGEINDIYLAGADPRDPRASPLFGSFVNAPPVLIQASQAEILADDARGVAEALARDGADVELSFWRGTPHAWQVFHGRLAEADAALDQVAAFVTRHMARTAPLAKDDAAR